MDENILRRSCSNWDGIFAEIRREPNVWTKTILADDLELVWFLLKGAVGNVRREFEASWRTFTRPFFTLKKGGRKIDPGWPRQSYCKTHAQTHTQQNEVSKTHPDLCRLDPLFLNIILDYLKAQIQRDQNCLIRDSWCWQLTPNNIIPGVCISPPRGCLRSILQYHNIEEDLLIFIINSVFASCIQKYFALSKNSTLGFIKPGDEHDQPQNISAWHQKILTIKRCATYIY